MGPHVFGDGRLGLWNITPRYVRDRARRVKELGFTDYFLPREATREQMDDARDAGLFASLWTAPQGRDAVTYGKQTAADIARLDAGAVDLNVELPRDVDLEAYMRTAIAQIRKPMPSRRVRLNIAWRKAAFLPVDLFQSDPHLYVAMQNYVDPPGLSMSPTSAADALLMLLDAGVPSAKAAVCYGAAGPVGGVTGAQRVNTLPMGGGWIPRRGVVFQDDLLADAGLL